jgi:hypothetical protein
MDDFRLCYNSHKYAPDRDSYLYRIQPHGLSQLMGPRSEHYLRYHHYPLNMSSNLATSVLDQATD